MVPRVLDVGRHPVRAGYVEAVAVLPTRQGTGLGTAVMRALGEVIAREFDLGALSTGEWHFYERLGLGALARADVGASSTRPARTLA